MSKILIFALSVLFVRSEVHLPRPEINVVTVAEVASNQPVLLSNIASANFVTTEQARDVLATQIFDGMTDGQSKKIKNQELVKLLRSKISLKSEINELKWTFFVPDEFALIAKRNIISEQNVRNEVSLAFQDICKDCKVTIKDIKLPTIRESNELTDCKLQIESLKISGSFLAPAVCHSAKETKTFWTSGTLKIQKKAAVSNRQFVPGEKLSAKEFRMELVDVTYAQDGVANLQDVEGQVAAKMILLNQPVFKSDLKREVAIAKGQVIRAVAGNDLFEVSSQAVAEETGYVGDLIKIKNSESQKTLSGQIVEKGVVRIQ